MSLLFIRSVFKKILLTIAATMVAFLSVEVGLRLFSPRYYPVIPSAYEYDPAMAYRLRPNAHLLATTDFQQESTANPQGAANFQDDFAGYEKLVFAVGDSYTQGIGVPADMSYPAQLDLILNETEQGFYAKKFGVVNLGVAGFGGEQSLLNLQSWATRFGQPAVILYLGCDNDFEDDLAFRSGDRKRTVIAGNPSWGILNNPLRLFFEKTHIGLLARASYRQRLRDRGVAEALPNGAKFPIAELESPILDRLERYAAEHGSLLVVGWSDDGESYRWLQAWASQRGIAFADWAPKANVIRQAIPKLPLDNPHSAGHHRGWVNQIIAREFARQIRARAN